MYYFIEIIRVFTVCIIVLGPYTVLSVGGETEYNPNLEGKENPPPLGNEAVLCRGV